MTSDGAEIVVLGVDPTDRLAAAELPQWVPEDATVLYRPPSTGWRPTGSGDALRDPPGALVAGLLHVGGGQPDPATIDDAIETAAARAEVPVRILRTTAPPGDATRSRWWTVGGWVVSALCVGVPLAAGALLATVGGLLPALLAILFLVATGALLVGFYFAHAAAEILRDDEALADVVGETVGVSGDGDGAGGGRSAGSTGLRARVGGSSRGRPVVVLPERNAAGVAAALRERGYSVELRQATSRADSHARS